MCYIKIECTKRSTGTRKFMLISDMFMVDGFRDVMCTLMGGGGGGGFH